MSEPPLDRPDPSRPTTPPNAGLELSSAAGRWVLLATILGSALAGIDATVVNVALPAIGTDLETDFAFLQWTVSAYALTLASFILLGGTLGDRFGRRRVFVAGIVWFALASAACGLAQDVGTLVAARALQGVGAALLTPGSLALLQVTFRGPDRARAIGAWSGLGGVATAIGPLLGGWLVEVASWRWVFLVNLPLAAIVVWLALVHVPESHDEGSDGTRVDWTGGLLGALALAGVTFALIESRRGPVVVGGAVAVGVLAGAAFVLRERRTAHPVLPLGVFAARQFSAVNGLTLVVYGGLQLVLFLLVLHLQVVAGFGPVAAGSALLPVTVLMLVLSARSGALAARIGPRRQLAIGPMVCVVGVLLLARVGPGASYLLDVLPGVVVFGLGLATMVAPLTAAALGAAPDEHAGMASGVNNAVARTGGLLSVAAVPALVGLAGVASGGGSLDPETFADGYRHALWIAAALLAVGALIGALAVSDDVLADDGPAPDEATPPGPSGPVTRLSSCAIGAPAEASACDHEGRPCSGRPAGDA